MEPALLAVRAEAGKNLFTWISCHGVFTLRAVKLAIRLLQVCCVLGFSLGTSFAAEDASIDRLLKKLPPPEKLVKQSAPQDPPLKDPLLTYAITSVMLRDMSQARLYSRKLSEKYPYSEVAALVYGNVAYRSRHYAEAAGACWLPAKPTRRSGTCRKVQV
jgi:hypothetical protein